MNIWLRYLTELLSGDANGAGSETLSTYTALGADVSNDLSNPSLVYLLTSMFASTLFDAKRKENLTKHIFSTQSNSGVLATGVQPPIAPR